MGLTSRVLVLVVILGTGCSGAETEQALSPIDITVTNERSTAVEFYIVNVNNAETGERIRTNIGCKCRVHCKMGVTRIEPGQSKKWGWDRRNTDCEPSSARYIRLQIPDIKTSQESSGNNYKLTIE